MTRKIRSAWCAFALVISGAAPTASHAASGEPVNLSVTPAGFETQRDWIKRNRSAHPGDRLTVTLNDGLYELAEPLTVDSNTRWLAAPGATVRLTLSRAVPKALLRPLSPQAAARVEPALRGRLRQISFDDLALKHGQAPPDVYADTGGLPDLFCAGRRLPLARFPRDTCMTINRVLSNGDPAKGPGGGVFEYRPEFADETARWAGAIDHGVWLKGYWRVMWENEAVRVAAIDTAARTITFAKPIPNGIGSKYHRPAGDGQEKYWLLNLLEAVRQPGDWCIDYRDREIYLYPPAEGELRLADDDRPVVQANDAHDSRLIGVTVEQSLGQGIHIGGGSGVLVAGCTVRDVDGDAVVLDGGARHTVQSCDLYDLGAGGVWLGGGDENATPRTPAGHRVVNNHIHHFAQLVRVYAAGINCGFTGGGGGGHHPAVGMYVAHNLIHDTPHGGILFGSWDSVFENNEIFRFCTFSNDLGAFYCYDRFDRNGNQTIRDNLIHDSDDGDGIYFDHDHRDAHVYGNTIDLHSRGKRGTGVLYKIGSQASNPQAIDCHDNAALDCNLGYQFVAALPEQCHITANIAVNCGKAASWKVVRDGKAIDSPAYAGCEEPSPKPSAEWPRDAGLRIDEYRKQLPGDDEIDRYNRTTPHGETGYSIEDRK